MRHGAPRKIDHTQFSQETTTPNPVRQRDGKPFSQLTTSTATTDELVVSFAPLPGEKLGLILTEPWTAIMAPAFYYELVKVGLLALESALSLVMLSFSINRIIRPIAGLAEIATGAVPGSVFHPVLNS